MTVFFKKTDIFGPQKSRIMRISQGTGKKVENGAKFEAEIGENDEKSLLMGLFLGRKTGFFGKKGP